MNRARRRLVAGLVISIALAGVVAIAAITALRIAARDDARTVASIAEWTVLLLSTISIGLSAGLIGSLGRTLERGRQEQSAASGQLGTLCRDVQASTRTLMDQTAAIEAGRRDGSSVDIDATIARMRETIERLADTIQLDHAPIALRCERHSVASIVAAAVGPSQAGAAERAIAMFSDTPRDLEVYADRGRIEQLLALLVETALRSTRIGGEVSIRSAAESDRVRFAISHANGDLLPRGLADAPRRGPETPDDELAFGRCRRIVSAHGGAFGIEGTRRGRVLWFSIPSQPRVLA